jgi:hypothetical protein
MSQIKDYKAEEVARDAKQELISDYESCKCDLAEIRQHEKEIANIRLAYNSKIVKYRKESVNRVLDFVRSEYRAGRICNIEQGFFMAGYMDRSNDCIRLENLLNKYKEYIIY